MSDDKCPICGDTGYMYLETFTDPEWQDKHYMDRDSKVGKFFCSIDHLIKWLQRQGYDVEGVLE